ncbi:MAG: hypothetical protein M0Z28_11670 [Rhodospirillales bacterium]|nr:hypothetical protein [Rhodospirillales bacterium]
MNGQRRATARRWRHGAAGALLALTWAGGAAAAEPGGEALMTVMGVVAPGATFGLLKHLGGIPGVEQVHFDLLHGMATVRLLPGATVSDEQLRAAVRGASYTPGEIRWKPPQAAAASP